MTKERKTLVTLLALGLLAGSASPQSLNRMQGDNGGDELAYLQPFFQGSDPCTGDFSGDLYYKVYPAYVLERCSGETTLEGIEYVVFDQDWIADDATLWGYTLTDGLVDSVGRITPDYDNPFFAFPEVPGAGLGNPNGDDNCPTPGYVSGWILTELYYDTTGEPAPQVLPADGEAHLVYSGFFPIGHSTVDPPSNSCGSPGNATLQWFRSADTIAGTGDTGENQTDWRGPPAGQGGSAQPGNPFGGWRDAGAEDFTHEATSGGAELALLFEEPMLNFVADVSFFGDNFGPDIGLAGWHVPIAIDEFGFPMPSDYTNVGLRVYDSQATTDGSTLAFAAANIGPTLIELGVGCLPIEGGGLGLNPGDPAFLPALQAFGVGIPQIDTSGCTPHPVWNSPLIPISYKPAFMEVKITWQAYMFDAVNGIVRSTNLLQNQFHLNHSWPTPEPLAIHLHDDPVCHDPIERELVPCTFQKSD